MISPRPVSRLSLTLLLLVVAVPATAQDESEHPLRGGESVWGMFYGYGFSHEINRSAGDVNIASAGIRWSHVWSKKGSGFLAGHPAFAVEGLPLLAFFQEPTTYAGGFNLLYEHHFAADGKLLPIWRIGAGALYANRPVPPGETKTNFSLLTGVALHYLVSERSAFEVEYRFHHVSNAQTGFRNPGVNVHTLLIGYSIYR